MKGVCAAQRVCLATPLLLAPESQAKRVLPEVVAHGCHEQGMQTRSKGTRKDLSIWGGGGVISRWSAEGRLVRYKNNLNVSLAEGKG